jgi:hypothetical protein
LQNIKRSNAKKKVTVQRKTKAQTTLKSKTLAVKKKPAGKVVMPKSSSKQLASKKRAPVSKK